MNIEERYNSSPPLKKNTHHVETLKCRDNTVLNRTDGIPMTHMYYRPMDAHLGALPPKKIN